MPKKGKPLKMNAQEEARLFRRLLRALVDDPVVWGWNAGVDKATDLASAVYLGLDNAGIAIDKSLSTNAARRIEAQFAGLDRRHRAAFLRAYRVAFSVNIEPLLQSKQTNAFMLRQLKVNVDLIRLIKRKHLPRVAEGVKQALKDAPFSRSHLKRYFRREWGYQDYPLRRIARDQVNKAIGNFNQIRQQEVGITHYEWLTAGDNRVRESRAENDGQRFAWGKAPSTGHPGFDIQCRCQAIGIIPPSLARSAKLGYARDLASIPKSWYRDSHLSSELSYLAFVS